MKKEYFCESALTPNEVEAGDSVEFIIKITAGKDYTAGKSRLIFDFPNTLGMSVPNLFHPEEPGFIEAYISNPSVAYNVKMWDMEIEDFVSLGRSSWRGQAARICVLDIDEGIKEGDIIELHWGETSRGFGPGTRVTHIVPCRDYKSEIHIKYYESHEEGLPTFGRDFKGHSEPVPACEEILSFRVKPKKASCIQVIRKTTGSLIVPRDIWWNHTEFSDPNTVPQISPVPKLNSSGVYESKKINISVKNTPLSILECPSMNEVFEDMNLYWGDIHTHSCYSVDCIQREKMNRRPGDLFKYGKECAGLDFCAVTDHHQPWDRPKNHVGEEGWNDLLEAVSKYNADGEFIVFPGIEYRCKRGDTAVIFNRMPDYSEIDDPSLVSIDLLWEKFQDKDYLTIPHFHNPGSLNEGEWIKNPKLKGEPVLEIYSCHGSYERMDALEKKPAMIKVKRDDRCGLWFLNNKFKYGFCANSDGHKGVIGTSGLTAVFAKELTRESILEAYRNRKVYATTNARIRMIFTANGSLMGSTLKNVDKKIFFINVTGENRLKKIEIFKNGNLFKRIIPKGINYQKEIKVEDESPSTWYIRVTQIDNHIAWSSPIWFEN